MGHGDPAGNVFKTSAEFWMNLQLTYDLRNAEKALQAMVRKRIEDSRRVLIRGACFTVYRTKQ